MNEPQGRHKRSAKNYLLDKPFQLKYTGFLVLIALVLGASLGGLLWRSSKQVIDQSRKTVLEGEETVRQGQTTIERGQEVIKQSRRVSEVVSMNIAKEYADSPELAKTFKEESERDEAKLTAEQQRLEKDAEFLKTRAAELLKQSQEVEQRQADLFLMLVLALVVLVVAIGLAGIVFTHKIAGPIYKMKRLFRQIAEGKLVLREKLRKGDELVHFFEAFEQMVERMRENQRNEIARVDTIVTKMETDHAEGAKMLQALRADMKDHLEP
jgi:nitrogen fixation/metabolism regulation signal transduction histidine kinase